MNDQTQEEQGKEVIEQSMGAKSASEPIEAVTEEASAMQKAPNGPIMVGFVVVISLLVAGLLVYRNSTDTSSFQDKTHASSQVNANVDATIDSADVEIEDEMLSVDEEISGLDADLNEVDKAINAKPEDLSTQ